MISVHFLLGCLTAFVIVFIFYACNVKGRQLRIKMVEKHKRFIHLVESHTDFIYYAQVYPKVQFEYLSPSAENFFGEGANAGAYISPEVAFRTIHPDDYDLLMKKVQGELDYNEPIIQRWKDSKGNYRTFEEYATPVYKNGRLVALQGVLRNIDERIKLQEKLDYQLSHDRLTGIYNRAQFETDHAYYNQEKNSTVGLILCDLDNLKQVNDTLGHQMGDFLLQETANLLKQNAPDNSSVSRIGGDEFVLIIEVEQEKHVQQILHTIHKEIALFNEKEAEFDINLSTGYAFASDSKGKMSRIFTEADQDMYRNKKQNKQI